MFNKKYFIPHSDLDEYKRLKALGEHDTPKKPKIKEAQRPGDGKKTYTKEAALDELLASISSRSVPKHLAQTRTLYLNFARVRIRSLNGNQSHILSECSKIRKTFGNIVLGLKKESFELTDEELLSILQDDKYSVSHRTLFNWFVKFSFSESGIEHHRNFTITQKPKNTLNNDKEIYSPEEYLQYIEYVQQVRLHTGEAIKSQHYANMWLFTIMHLIDAWRPSDIVTQLPSIDIDDIGISSLDWFISNKLTTEQAQVIVNQVYLKTRHATVSKTNAMLTFLVPLDMLLPASTAMLICELHRRKSDDEFLLHTLVTVNRNARQPNQRHLRFFKFNQSLRDFKSLVMTRSTMTYFFYSLAEDNQDAELALTRTQFLRSHQNEDSTSVYVQATNADGSINRVSMNLFRRGHFGWIFNYLIILVFGDKNHGSLEDRTNSIAELRKEMTPIQLENWAAFLRRVQDQRKSIIYKLNAMNRSDLKNLLTRILRGELPAKTDGGQCLTYPKCAYPKLRSCLYCDYFIPQTYLLIDMKHEFYRLIQSINTSPYPTIVERDSEFLKFLLLILNEAVSVYGSTYVQTFIDLKDIQTQVLNSRERLVFHQQ